MRKLAFGAIFSPAALVVLSAALTLAYVTCHLAGWREQVSVFSGTITQPSSTEAQVVKAALYAGLYFAVVLLVPILLLAALFQLVVLWLFASQASPPGPDAQQPTHSSSDLA